MAPIMRRVWLVTALQLISTASCRSVPGRAASDHVERATIPDYAIQFAPYSYLHSAEQWWPSDVATHLEHCTPELDDFKFKPKANLRTIKELAPEVYMTSDDNVEENPAWLRGAKPDGEGNTTAPATIIVVDKTDYVDVFYFQFYSYNHGLNIFGNDWGSHVGDWEHITIRFVDGSPQYVYLSRHRGGNAYTYEALEKLNSRPVTYIASSSHANYATPGKQAYQGNVLGSIGLFDTTDAGVYWDITQNYRGFTYDVKTSTFTMADGAGIGAIEAENEGADWLKWLGTWGRVATGPFAKKLERRTVCEYETDCIAVHKTDWQPVAIVPKPSSGLMICDLHVAGCSIKFGNKISIKSSNVA